VQKKPYLDLGLVGQVGELRVHVLDGADLLAKGGGGGLTVLLDCEQKKPQKQYQSMRDFEIPRINAKQKIEKN
jgi:hypothetical protein